MVAREPVSPETPLGEEDESHPGDFLVDQAHIPASEQMINVNLHDRTAEVLKSLSPRGDKDHSVAIWLGRRQRTYSRRSGAQLQRDARTYPADWGQGAAKTAASEP